MIANNNIKFPRMFPSLLSFYETNFDQPSIIDCYSNIILKVVVRINKTFEKEINWVYSFLSSRSFRCKSQKKTNDSCKDHIQSQLTTE